MGVGNFQPLKISSPRPGHPWSSLNSEARDVKKVGLLPLPGAPCPDAFSIFSVCSLHSLCLLS